MHRGEIWRGGACKTASIIEDSSADPELLCGWLALSSEAMGFSS